MTDERILELAKEAGASKVFVAGYAISGDKKIIEFARMIITEYGNVNTSEQVPTKS